MFGSRLPVYNRARREQQGRQSVTRQRSAIRLSDSRPCPLAMGLAIPYDDYVSKAKPWYEVLRKVAFSPFGLFVLNASYAILGAYMFIWLERPNEEKQKNLKVDKTAEVHDAVAYLKTTFWQYATNEDRFNYTKDEFFEAVSEDLATLKLFVVEYANTYGVDSIDGTVNWDWSWTFPKSLLFTITIMTTIGKRYICFLSIKLEKNPPYPFYRLWAHIPCHNCWKTSLHHLHSCWMHALH